MKELDVIVKIDDLAQILGLSSSTVKKYYLLIEKRGYYFQRTRQGHVMFGQGDIELFKKIVRLKNHPDLTLDTAIEKVMSSVTVMTDPTDINQNGRGDITDITVMSKGIEDLQETIKKQNDLIEKQQEYLEELTKNNNKSTRLIESSIEKRDQQITQYMNEIIEVKKILREKNKKWWEFWKD